MSSESQPALNLELFQVRPGSGELEIVQGIAVKPTPIGVFLDPQNAFGHPTSVTPQKDLVLGLGRELATEVTPDGCILEASLAVQPYRDDHHYYNFREPLGSDRLSLPVEIPVGSVALLGLAEQQEFRLMYLSEGGHGQTRVIHAADMTRSSQLQLYKTKLIVLALGGYINVSSGKGRLMDVYSLRYDADASRIRVETIDNPEDGGFERGDGGSHDRQPIRPRPPVDSAGAAVEPPQEQEERVHAVGHYA